MDSRRRFRPERALILAALAGVFSRGVSILPRTRQDETMIMTGAELMGAAVGLAAEGATCGLARFVPGRRVGATAVLSGLALGAFGWGRKHRGSGKHGALAETCGLVLLGASAGGEAAVRAYRRLPGGPRSGLAAGVSITAIGAAFALRGLRARMAEPHDLVKAGIPYTFTSTVSGGDRSLLPVDVLDREGRKFLGCATPASLIEEVTGGEALDPIRVYAGLGSSASPLQRARQAVQELVRLGGLERSRLVFYCPTGAGFVNPVAVQAEEIMSRGDVASFVVQYSNKRSVRALKHIARAREIWWLVLEELDRVLAAVPAEQRPQVIVYGESLGAQVIAEALAEGGTATLESFGIDRGILIGLPFAAGQQLRALRERGEPLPAGLGVFSDLEALQALSAEERDRIRYLIFTHAEDPVANFSRQLLWERPAWLRAGRRPARLPAGMRWLPGITYLQVMFDIKNGTTYTPRFDSYAHDYRAELPTLLRVAFGHADISDDQLRAIELATVRSYADQAEREERARSPANAP